MESNIRQADGHPGEKSGDGGQILEPGKHFRGAGRSAHECEQANGPGEQDTPIWYTILGSL